MSEQSIDRTLEQAARRSAARAGGAAVVIGNFDGVHLGHQALLSAACEARALKRVSSVVALTFWPHPARTFKPDIEPFELMTLEQRGEHLRRYGADAILALAFDERLAALTPREFVERVLLGALKAKHVVVGEDFHFGKGRAGDVSTLATLGSELGFTALAHEPVRDAQTGQVISSTRVRQLVRRGDVEGAARLLGHAYELSGEVVQGDARGRELGFPTANILAEQEVFVPDGIYTSTLHSARFGALKACTYIGSRPTYEHALGRNVETFVLDEAAPQGGLDLYGERIRLALHRWQREDEAFEGSEALIAQIGRDVEIARRWHRASRHGGE